MKILVVGAGYWGPNIVRNLVDFSEVKSIGISDLETAMTSLREDGRFVPLDDGV